MAQAVGAIAASALLRISFGNIAKLGATLPLNNNWLFEEWQLDDPAEQPEIFPRVRDEIKERVTQLIESLETAPVA